MSKSILQDKRECFFTGATTNIDRHHIYFGANRKVSEEQGFWIWLKHDLHIAGSPHQTPHNCRNIDLYLKQMCQKKYEETHSREEFMALIGRSYL